jgi:uncharacterized protein (TIGR02246 family)
MSEDENQIRHVIQTWMDASRRNDVATVLELMTEDVLFLTAGKPPFGKAEFAKGMESMRGMTFDATNDIQEIEIHGDWAFVRGELKVHAKTPDGKETSRAGSVMSIFRRGPDGKWRIARDANLLTSK